MALDAGLHPGPSPSPSPLLAGREVPPTARANLAFPRPPPGTDKTLGSVKGGGACSRHCSREPTFPGYLPDLVSPNTQFIFLSGAASLFSAAFRGQGSPGSRQRLSRGRNSFETWLSTLVLPRMGRMHDPVSGGQLREKHSLTLASPAGEEEQTPSPAGSRCPDPGTPA